MEPESIATTPFRVVCGPTTTTHLPTMIHRNLAAADLRRADEVCVLKRPNRFFDGTKFFTAGVSRAQWPTGRAPLSSLRKQGPIRRGGNCLGMLLDDFL